MSLVRSAVVVVDMQNAFCSPEGSFVQTGLGPSSTEGILEPISELVGIARDRGIPVLYTRQFYPDDSAEWDSATKRRFTSSSGVLALGSWDNAIIDELPVHATDVVIDKPRYDAFHSTELEDHLKALQVNKLVVVGAVTNVCVLLTAMGAWARGFEFAVPSDTTTARTAELKDFALETLSAFGDVRPWREVMSAEK